MEFDKVLKKDLLAQLAQAKRPQKTELGALATAGSLLISSGVPIFNALWIMFTLTDNPRIRYAVYCLHESISSGEPLGSALHYLELESLPEGGRLEKEFYEDFADFIEFTELGEETGELDRNLLLLPALWQVNGYKALRELLDWDEELCSFLHSFTIALRACFSKECALRVAARNVPSMAPAAHTAILRLNEGHTIDKAFAEEPRLSDEFLVNILETAPYLEGPAIALPEDPRTENSEPEIASEELLHEDPEPLSDEDVLEFDDTPEQDSMLTLMERLLPLLSTF